MKMISVDSEAILEVGYDSATKRMTITFKQGKSYDFCGVPANIFEGLVIAASVGSYYNDHVRDRYQC